MHFEQATEIEQLNPKAILLARLTVDELDDLAIFDCSNKEMNDFFKEDAYREQEKGLNNTYLLYYKGSLAAACSVCCDAISLNEDEKEEEDVPYTKVPAIKIARLARDLNFHGLGLGKFLVRYVKQHAYALHTDGNIGVRFITVDAYPDKVPYYQNAFGFIVNKSHRIKEGRPVSMRLDIFDNLPY